MLAVSLNSYAIIANMTRERERETEKYIENLSSQHDICFCLIIFNA